MNPANATTNLSDLDARVLRATPPHGRSASLIADRAGCLPDIALSTLRRLRGSGLVEDDGYHPPREWLRTHRGDAALEFVP
ncbi:MAG: hypothetical protein ACXVS6_06900 [Solirubrobacteraceae bacterium]